MGIDNRDYIAAVDKFGQTRTLQEIEKEAIEMAIVRLWGRMACVARELGIGRSTLYRKLKDLKINVDKLLATEEDPS